MEYEVDGPRPRGRPKRTWREVVREDCQACKLNKEDAMDRCKWRKVIKDVRWSGWVWVGECFFWYWPTRVVQDKRPLNGCVCVQCYVDKHDLESNSEINYGKTRRDLYESKPHLPSHKTQVNSKSFISLTYDMTVLPVDCQHRLLSVTGNKNRS